MKDIRPSVVQRCGFFSTLWTSCKAYVVRFVTESRRGCWPQLTSTHDPRNDTRRLQRLRSCTSCDFVDRFPSPGPAGVPHCAQIVAFNVGSLILAAIE